MKWKFSEGYKGTFLDNYNNEFIVMASDIARCVAIARKKGGVHTTIVDLVPLNHAVHMEVLG